MNNVLFIRYVNQTHIQIYRLRILHDTLKLCSRENNMKTIDKS